MLIKLYTLAGIKYMKKINHLMMINGLILIDMIMIMTYEIKSCFNF